MTITAVVVSYWDHRRHFVNEIVSSLREQTVQPDNVIVFNNNPDHSINIPDAFVVNSGKNFTSRCKYPAALLIPSDYYLLLDDDVSPMNGCIENYMKYASDGCCMSDYGIKFLNNYYHQGHEIKAHEISEPVKVEAFIGRTQFLSFEAICNMMQAEKLVRLDDSEYLFDGEDILIGMANETSQIIPSTDNSHTFSFDGAQEKNMQSDYGYHQLRDMFAFKAWKILKGEPFPGPQPGDEFDVAAAQMYKDAIMLREHK